MENIVRINDETARDVCKYQGEGPECCRYVGLSAEGLFCCKGDYALRMRADKEANQGGCSGDNCSGAIKEEQDLGSFEFGKFCQDAYEAYIDSLVLLQKRNLERGDSWKAIGALGLFLEVRTMYLRLRGLFWDSLSPAGRLGSDNKKEDFKSLFRPSEKWQEDVLNATIDMRNYTVLFDMALKSGNIYGYGEDDETLI
jgi:hypothetical protein